MLKLIKWDARIFLHKYFWALIAIPFVLLLIMIPQNGQGFFNALMVIISCLSAGLLYIGLLFLAAVQPIDWLHRDTTQLERSLPVSAWKPLFSKILFSFAINTIACIFMLQFALLVGRFSHDGSPWITLQHLSGIGVVILILTMLDTTLLFAYMISKSVDLFRKQPVLFSGILGFLLINLIAASCLYLLVITNGIMLPVVSTRNVLTVNGSLIITSMITVTGSMLVVIGLEYICSALLLDTRFQQE